MDSRTEERVADWDSRPLTDGYESLRDLEDESFSGVVEARGTTLFMLNGKVVGVTSGSLDAFEDASGTIYEAPHPSLPLLFAMQEQGGEERAKYYTNDTPISEADDTLSSGSFTGYIELSENVLSGDYYVVYYGGRSMSCAFVGNSERLVTDDEAFDRADDEVGIYTVWDVDIEVTAVPGREDEADEDTEAAAGAVDDDAQGAGAAGAGSAGAASTEAGTGDDAPPEEAAAGAGADETAGAGADEPASASGAADAGGSEGVPVRDAENDSPGAGGDDAVARPPPDAADAAGTEAADAAGADTADAAGADAAGADAAGAGEPADARAPDADESVVSEAEPGTDHGQTPPEDTGRNAAGGQPSAGEGNRAATGRRAQSDATTGTEPAGRGREEAGTEAVDDDAAGSAMAEVPDEVMAEVESEAQSNEFAEEIAWRETTKIPSINPERSSTDDDEESADPLATGGSAGRTTESGAAGSTQQRPRTGGSSQPSGRGSADAGATGGRGGTDGRGAQQPDRSTSEPQGRSTGGQQGAGTDSRSGTGGASSGSPDAAAGSGGAGAGGGEAASGDVESLQSELASVREERDSLAAEREQLEAERDELAARNTELASRVEELEAEIEDLEGELADMRTRLENAGGGVSPDAVELTASEALEGTNLFVRYGSKSATTMEDVHDSDVTVADLEANLRLEYHTGFDADNAVVDGKPYEEFLYESIEYGFVEWFVYDLVFEVRDTGNEQALGDLYQAFPKVDRIELQGDVSLRYDQDGEEHREQSTFDVVVRDRMGNPLAVADVNDRRDPATEDMMVDLQQRSERVKRTSDALAGAFMVTSSYFDPGALEIADEATSGSLLSRDSKKSYVKLSRKQGYHLCLVETRNGEFHVNVPEL